MVLLLFSEERCPLVKSSRLVLILALLRRGRRLCLLRLTDDRLTRTLGLLLFVSV
jgi:hypothetical protein